MTVEDLAVLCQRGYKSAWEELYKIYKPRVLKIARRFFLCGGESEDLVQEGMCGLYSAVNGYRSGGGSFFAYADRCIRNRIVDTVKKSGADRHSALNNFLPIFEIGEKCTTGESPEDEVIMREDRRELLLKMSKNLSSLEFKAFEMYTEGMTMSEISSALGKTAKSVDNALNRAKNKLQKLISEED